MIFCWSSSPGVMNRLFEGTTSDRHPRLIYCSLTGYGQTVLIVTVPDTTSTILPIRVKRTSRRQNSGPVPGFNWPISQEVLSHGDGLAAVIHRQQTGEGQYIDLSMTDAVFSMHALSAQNGSVVGKNLRRKAGCLTETLYDYYETRDGRWISVEVWSRFS